jgi:hypothetical protein
VACGVWSERVCLYGWRAWLVLLGVGSVGGGWWAGWSGVGWDEMGWVGVGRLGTRGYSGLVSLVPRSLGVQAEAQALSSTSPEAMWAAELHTLRDALAPSLAVADHIGGTGAGGRGQGAAASVSGAKRKGGRRPKAVVEEELK